MTLRHRIIVYLAVLHGLLAVMAFMLLREQRIYFLLVEVGLLFSAWLAHRLLKTFFVPLELLGTGAELIQERDFSSRFHPVGQPEMDQLIEVYNQMIEQLRGERLRVREQNELFDQLVAASPGGFVVVDLDGRIASLNPAAESFLGQSAPSLAGKQISAVDNKLGRVLSQLETSHSRVVALGDGRRVRCQRAGFRDRGFVRSFYLIEELTEEIRHSEKAAYEKLIRLMSHEVMNSVTSVSSLLTSARSYGSALAPDDASKFDRALTVAADRMKHLGSFMNGFADVVRLPEPSLQEDSLERLLADLMTLFEPTFAERRIDLQWQQVDPLPLLRFDKNQLEQVLVNLLQNAAEAIDQDGTVTLRSGTGTDTKPGSKGFAWLEIVDTGPGIPDAVRDELFTPFFTTKDNGRGLGLMVVKEVLLAHGFPFAFDNLESTPASPDVGGALFRIEFSS